MVGNYCCVTNCHSSSHDSWKRKLNNGIRFFGFPVVRKRYGKQMEEVTRRRRLAWVSAVRRLDIITMDSIPLSMKVCSRHFHFGKPSYEMYESHRDWAPTLRLGHSEINPTDSGEARQEHNVKDCGMVESALIEPKIEIDSALIEPKIEIDVAEETPACWLTKYYQDTESQTGNFDPSTDAHVADSTDYDVERVVIKTEPKEEPDTASDEKPALSHSVDTVLRTNQYNIETNKTTERSRKRRMQFRADPQSYARFKLEEAARSKKRRREATEAQKQHARETARVRVAAYRERKKAQQTSKPAQPTSKPAVKTKVLTKTDKKRLLDQRERAKLAQRKRRANMSSPKRQREREKDRAKYWTKKEAKLRDNNDKKRLLDQKVRNKLEQRKRRANMSSPKRCKQIQVDPQSYGRSKLEEAARSKRRRREATEAQKQHARETARVRVAAYRERKKAQPTSKPAQPTSKPAQPTSKPAVKTKVLTKTDKKRLLDQRERAKLAQRKRRASMSSPKRQREREKDRAKYWTKKEAKLRENIEQ